MCRGIAGVDVVLYDFDFGNRELRALSAHTVVSGFTQHAAATDVPGNTCIHPTPDEHSMPAGSSLKPLSNLCDRSKVCTQTVAEPGSTQSTDSACPVIDHIDSVASIGHSGLGRAIFGCSPSMPSPELKGDSM